MSKIYRALEKARIDRDRKGTKTSPPLKSVEEEQRLAEILFWPESTAGKISGPHLVSFFQHDNIASEQFRKLRTHLTHVDIGSPPKTIMVTSSTDGEGKTFVAANLAIGIAHDLQTHALLVECDLRNPSLAPLFGLEGDRGLSDYLTGGAKISELIGRTEMEKLKVITGGSSTRNPAELIGSKKMEALIRELRSRYEDRYVILDSTPLLSTTEPEVLAKLVDGVVIVVRAGVTPRETVKQAIASLEKERILGFVLNDLQFSYTGLASRYFGSYGGDYQYGYGQEDGSQNPKGFRREPSKKS